MLRFCLLPLFAGVTLVVVAAAGAQIQAPPAVWTRIDPELSNGSTSPALIHPARFSTFALDHAQLRDMLRNVHKESRQSLAGSEASIALPMPDGTVQRFRFVESPVMADGLAAKFPEIRTFLGKGIDDPSATVRFDVTPAGLHAQILRPGGAVYVDPVFATSARLHASYLKRDYRQTAESFRCALPESESVQSLVAPVQRPPVTSGTDLRTFRLACAATAEYTQFQGGTVADGMAAIVTAINRVTGIYESELAIRLLLVTNNDLLIYTNADTDPYSNSNGVLMLGQNQSNLDNVIGATNYDIGHVFGTGGLGIANVGCVCVNGSKARGVSGVSDPVGDPFFVDYVAHEMGHQFGATHPFNSSMGACSGTRDPMAAFEPGSGSTIMAYTGICGSDNLQMDSDPYFHSVSLEQIVAFITTNAACAVSLATSNHPPTVNAEPAFTIPKGTPFILTASGADPDGESLTFCWEERDLGPSIPLAAPDNGSSPLFRSFSPTTSPSRIFPNLSDILSNTVTLGEMLPSTNRVMNFRVTARDNQSSGGAIQTADTQVTVASNAGPFRVTSPNDAVTWSNVQTIAWDVAGTTNPPVNATNVNILLSSDAGLTYPFVLATNVPNLGAMDVLLPNISTTNARIQIQAAGNIFFDISHTNFSLISLPADLAMGLSASSPWVTVGSNLTYSVVVTNLGPGTATSVSFTDALPSDLTLLSVGSSQGVSTNYGSQVVAALGDLTNGSVASITIQVTATNFGQLTNTAAAFAAANDPDTTNNSCTVVVSVTPYNHAPALAAITNAEIDEGILLTFTNVASDPDPQQILIFSLNNAPAGANIDTNTGVFMWTPTEDQGPGTFIITVAVTDNGFPNLSNSQSFTVVVDEINQAPVLAPITDRSIHAGSTLWITNTATDSDIPANYLTFTLATNSPAGAAINPDNGVFVWPTSGSDANTTNPITIVVTDDGSPMLSNTQRFTVTVLPPPLFSPVILSNGLVKLEWSAISGMTYLVQYKDDLLQSNWSEMSSNVTSSGPFATTVDAAVAQRFYRVVLVP